MAYIVCHMSYRISYIVAQCTPNNYLTGGSCVAIPAGYIRPQAFLSNVIYACPAGFYSLKEASACIACPAGTHSSAVGSSACTACPAGTYFSFGECQPVPAGMFCIFACRLVCLSIGWFVCLFVDWFACRLVCLSIGLFVCLFV